MIGYRLAFGVLLLVLLLPLLPSFFSLLVAFGLIGAFRILVFVLLLVVAVLKVKSYLGGDV